MIKDFENKVDYNFNLLHDGEDNIDKKIKNTQENICEYYTWCDRNKIGGPNCLDNYRDCKLYQYFNGEKK